MRLRAGERPSFRCRGRASAGVRLLMFAWLMLGLVPRMSKAEPASQNSVHAAYLINFLRYAEWPPEAMGQDQHVVVVVGPAAATNTLRALAARAGPIDGRTVVVRGLGFNPGAPAREEAVRLLAVELSRAHMVYVAESHRSWNQAVVRAAARRPILTVGVGCDFIRSGGMLALFEDRGRVAFCANVPAIKGASVHLSARVLVLARPLRRED